LDCGASEPPYFSEFSFLEGLAIRFEVSFILSKSGGAPPQFKTWRNVGTPYASLVIIKAKLMVKPISTFSKVALL
jgi:hypothetical protein